MVSEPASMRIEQVVFSSSLLNPAGVSYLGRRCEMLDGLGLVVWGVRENVQVWPRFFHVEATS